jgi:hypothetical protein
MLLFDFANHSASDRHTLFCDNYGVTVTTRRFTALASSHWFQQNGGECSQGNFSEVQEFPSLFLATEDQKRVRFHGPFNPFGFEEFLTSQLGPVPSQKISEL